MTLNGTFKYRTAAAVSEHASTTPTVEQYALFDVLRFVLASSVMLSHMGVLVWAQAGGLAVQVFFALSGWLIGGILYDTEARNLSRFYFNRSTRIWIPYFFCVAALYLTSIFHEAHRSQRFIEFLAYDLTFTHNWFTLWPDAVTALNQMPLRGTGNHFWSLATEEQFYLAAPLLMTLLPFGRTVLFWAIVAAMAFVFENGYAAISFGVLAAVTVKKFPGAHLSTVGQMTLLISATVSAVAMYRGATFTYVAPIFAVSAVLLVARPMARNAFMRWIGGVSFPFYLNAWIGVFALHALEKRLDIGGFWAGMTLVFAVGLGAGAISYQLIDMPVLANRNRFYRTRLGWILGGIGYVLVATGVALWLFIWRNR